MNDIKKMDPKIKKKWVKALRSGKYKQGRGFLRTQDNGFCCLGVLCDISGLGKWDYHNNYVAAGAADRDNYIPPIAVLEWADLYVEQKIGRQKQELVAYNDGQEKSAVYGRAVRPRTFAQIADIIEKHL